jgi:hypothetical protein
VDRIDNSNNPSRHRKNDNVGDNRACARNNNWRTSTSPKARERRPASASGNYNRREDVKMQMSSDATPAGVSSSISLPPTSRPHTSGSRLGHSLTSSSSSLMHHRITHGERDPYARATRVERDPYDYGYKVKKFIPAEDRGKSFEDRTWERARDHGTSWPGGLTNSMRRSHWKS